MVHRTVYHDPALRFNQMANEQRKAYLFDQLNVAFNRRYDFRSILVRYRNGLLNS